MFSYSGTPNLVEQMTMATITEGERQHWQRVKHRWERYEGTFPKPLKKRPNQPDDNVSINKLRLIVDKGVSFLFGQGVGFQLDENDQLPEEDYLDAVWLNNRRMTKLQQIATNGGVAGHTFVKMALDWYGYPRTIQQTEGGEPDPNAGKPIPRLIVLDPETVWPTWDENDLDHVLRWRIQWNGVDPQTGKPIIRRQLITPRGDEPNARWLIRDEYQFVGAQSWTLLQELLWPFTWAPIFHCQNLPNPNEFWGCPDISDDIIHVNEMMNLNYSNWLRIQLTHGHPRTWGRGLGATQDLKLGIDEIAIFQSADAHLETLQMQSQGEGAKVLADTLDEKFHELTRVPPIATGKVESVGAFSGVALQILYQPLIEKTQTKQATYGDLLVEINRAILEIGGYGANRVTQLVWPNLLPKNDLEEAQAAVLWQQAGVSQDTLMEKAGFDPMKEAEKRTASAEQGGGDMLAAFDRGQV